MFKKYDISSDLDSPETSVAHRNIITKKPFLRQVYKDWYSVFIKTAKGVAKGKYLEIGSGGGFLKEVFPEVITSDVVALPDMDMVVNAEELPFTEKELGCIMMLNVFHHIPRPWIFLKEAERCLVKGGKIVMIEPANSTFGRFIYKRFHHEPFDEKGGREIETGHRMSSSNQALPYIYFERDLEQFKKDFPSLKINKVKYHSPMLYLISGGVSRSAMFPFFTYGFFSLIEKMMLPFGRQAGLFCTVEIEKI